MRTDNRIIKRIYLLSFACWIALAGITGAKEETEPQTEVITQELPEDGILYFDFERAQKGALQISEKEGKTYIAIVDAEDEEIILDLRKEPEVYYATTALYMRALPDIDSEIVQILKIEQEVTVFGEMEEWYLVRTEKGYGFVSQKYLTDNAAEAEQAAAAEQAAQEAARQSAGSQQTAAQAQSPQGSGGIYEIRRENVPSCEDGSHGTTYVTYSDGSIQTFEY